MPGLGRGRLAASIAVSTAALAAAFAAPAAAVTLGQIPSGAPPAFCDGPLDLVQPSVTSGNAYVVPSTGGVSSWTVTSWGTNASVQAGQTAGLRFFRKIGDPAKFQVVGHEAQHNLVPGVNTFPSALQVSAGDLLGMYYTGSGACSFDAPDLVYFVQEDLPDGQSSDFNGDGPARLNVTAEVTPTGDFTLAKPKSKSNGTAVLRVTVPNPGVLTASGGGAAKASPGAVAAKQVPAAGKVKLVIKAKGLKKRKLARKGKVTVKPKITFTPTGGIPNSEFRKIKLHRR
jgi:hypothetical protein